MNSMKWMGAFVLRECDTSTTNVRRAKRPSERRPYVEISYIHARLLFREGGHKERFYTMTNICTGNGVGMRCNRALLRLPPQS